MRTTTLGFLFSIATAAACAPVGAPGPNTRPDGGSGSATAKCDTTNIQSVDGDWTMNANDDVGQGIPDGCYTLNGSLTITGADVDSMSQLGDLRGVTDLTIQGTMLAKIDTPAMIHVTGSVTINQNTALTDLSNIDIKTADVLTGITVTFNDSLTSLGRLNRPSDVTGAVEIGQNNALTTIDLSQITRAEGGLSIHDNAEVTTLKLTALNAVGKLNGSTDFVVRNNGQLTSLGSLASLQFIHGNLIIDNNDQLATLDDSMVMQGLNIDLNMQITNNALLASLGQLAHSTRIGQQLQVENNGTLLYCNAREIGCCVSHTSDIISGNKTANDNGCPHSWCYASNGNSCPFQY